MDYRPIGTLQNDLKKALGLLNSGQLASQPNYRTGNTPQNNFYVALNQYYSQTGQPRLSEAEAGELARAYAARRGAEGSPQYNSQAGVAYKMYQGAIGYPYVTSSMMGNSAPGNYANDIKSTAYVFNPTTQTTRTEGPIGASAGGQAIINQGAARDIADSAGYVNPKEEQLRNDQYSQAVSDAVSNISSAFIPGGIAASVGTATLRGASITPQTAIGAAALMVASYILPRLISDGIMYKGGKNKKNPPTQQPEQQQQPQPPQRDPNDVKKLAEMQKAIDEANKRISQLEKPDPTGKFPWGKVKDTAKWAVPTAGVTAIAGRLATMGSGKLTNSGTGYLRVYPNYEKWVNDLAIKHNGGIPNNLRIQLPNDGGIKTFEDYAPQIGSLSYQHSPGSYAIANVNRGFFKEFFDYGPTKMYTRVPGSLPLKFDFGATPDSTAAKAKADSIAAYNYEFLRQSLAQRFQNNNPKETPKETPKQGVITIEGGEMSAQQKASADAAYDRLLNWLDTGEDKGNTE